MCYTFSVFALQQHTTVHKPQFLPSFCCSFALLCSLYVCVCACVSFCPTSTYWLISFVNADPKVVDEINELQWQVLIHIHTSPLTCALTNITQMHTHKWISLLAQVVHNRFSLQVLTQISTAAACLHISINQICPKIECFCVYFTRVAKVGSPYIILIGISVDTYIYINDVFCLCVERYWTSFNIIIQRLKFVSTLLYYGKIFEV